LTAAIQIGLKTTVKTEQTAHNAATWRSSRWAGRQVI
jgi:hypothetical protein